MGETVCGLAVAIPMGDQIGLERRTYCTAATHATIGEGRSAMAIPPVQFNATSGENSAAPLTVSKGDVEMSTVNRRSRPCARQQLKNAWPSDYRAKSVV